MCGYNNVQTLNGVGERGEEVFSVPQQTIIAGRRVNSLLFFYCSAQKVSPRPNYHGTYLGMCDKMTVVLL